SESGDLAQYLKPDHPDVYVVVRGDTLWDISKTFLERPWLWPEIWRINPQIDNPHLIYPGDSIALVWVEGQPRLVLERGVAGRTYKLTPGDTDSARSTDSARGPYTTRGPDAARATSTARGTDTVMLEPKIRAISLESAIPAIHLDAIQGFLVQNRVVTPEVLLNSPYVVQGESDRLVLGGGDRLYVRGDLADTGSFSIMRRGPVYIDPQTNEVLGQEATYVGLGQTVAREGDIATMLLLSTRQEVQIGDRVLATEERKVDSTFYPSAPENDTRGQIISVFNGVTQVGPYDVVVLNRGVREGLEVGNVLAIYKRGALARDRIANESIRLPSERAGLLMVFRTFEKLSYGLVLTAQRPLSINDEVRNP
ncbi:MAG: LysM peptidoglycan-binding domain-containing protein, partial [Gammaproteobacteria bacterium]|nr:LysM peptidoglycan-binding domain-containing protein [Gammaproteobacteria bacterium]